MEGPPAGAVLSHRPLRVTFDTESPSMSSKPIIGANHRAAMIEIPLPVDENGEYAFDEAGKPVRGRKPVVLHVPRFDCMTRQQFRDVTKALSAVSEMKDDDGNDLSAQDQSFEVVLAMLRPFVSDEDYKIVGNLRLFELEQIANRIKERSTIDVGELLASTNS